MVGGRGFVYLPCLYRHHLPLLCYIAFRDLDLGLGSQGQHTAVKPAGFIFFSIPFCIESVQVEYLHSSYYFCVRFFSPREINAVLLIMSPKRACIPMFVNGFGSNLFS